LWQRFIICCRYSSVNDFASRFFYQFEIVSKTTLQVVFLSKDGLLNRPAMPEIRDYDDVKNNTKQNYNSSFRIKQA